VRLLRFRPRGKEPRLGVVVDDGVADLSGRLPELSYEDLLGPAGLAAAATASEGAAADYAFDEIDYAVPLAAGSKVLCIGRNYGRYHEVRREGRPRWPSVFARFASSFAAHGQPIVRPAVSEQLDYEGELGVVIGSRARHVSEGDALAHVAGYTIVNEGSVRDWQRYGSQNCPGKNFWHSGALGPWIVTRDEIEDWAGVTITTRVDGTTRQHGSTGEMLFGVPELISHISRFTWLEPGDLIATGSPGGSAVDSDPPPWLRPGQTVEIEIESIGVLRNVVEAE
jgi:2-keto-4-pentenoate hydratase/2-oxohepta-3-ene-1,7-dioic acid hydratase in catechol pathway